MAEEGAEAKTDGKETEIDIPISVPAEGAEGEAPAEGAADAPKTDAAEGAPADAPADAAEGAAGEMPAEAGAADAPAAEADATAAAEGGAEPGAPADGAAEGGTDAPGDAAETPAAPADPTAPATDLEDKDEDGTREKPADGKTDEPTPPAEESKEDPAKSAVDRLSKGVEGVIGDFESGLEAIPDPSLRSALEDWAKRMNVHVQELRTIMSGDTESGEAPAVPPLPGALDEEESRPSVTEEEMQSVRDIGRQLASHRTGRTTQEVEQWTDPEESAKEVEELRRVRRQIRYIFWGMLQSLPETGTLRVDDLISDAGTSEAQVRAPVSEKPPPLPGKTSRDVGKVPMPPQGKPEGHGRPRSGGTELSSVTDSSAVSWNSQVTEEETRRKEKKERKSRKHRHHSADAHADRSAKKDDGALPKPYNWAEEVVKASLDPQNQWEFPAPSGKAGYVGSLAAWEQPRARGTEVASRARERAEEVQRWERHHDSQQQYIFGTPR